MAEAVATSPVCQTLSGDELKKSSGEQLGLWESGGTHSM